MPTIEIASIDSIGLGLNQADFEIAIIEENKLKSHRGLFYDLLESQNGIIIHIGNPSFKDDKEGGFFAGQIIDWNFGSTQLFIPNFDENEQHKNHVIDQQFKFKFLDEYKDEIDKLLKIALDKSPVKKVFFLTDYQCGLEKQDIEIIYTISKFWKIHNDEGLIFNTMYELHAL